MTDPYGHILSFLGRSRYFFFQVAPQLYSRDCEDPAPDPLVLRRSGSAGNRTRTPGSVGDPLISLRITLLECSPPPNRMQTASNCFTPETVYRRFVCGLSTLTVRCSDTHELHSQG
jgi:hypothetical protein